MRTKQQYRQGDTIIEVTLAISIFAMMMVGGLAIMNSALAKAQGTLQLTMARNSIDSQAEALRFINNAYMAQYPNITAGSTAAKWDAITSSANTAKASSLSDCKSSFESRDFAINNRNLAIMNGAKLKSATTYPRIVNSEDTNVINESSSASALSEGLWIESVKNNSGTTYYDFHIRACWAAPGSNVNTTLGTIVRLYDPKR